MSRGERTRELWKNKTYKSSMCNAMTKYIFDLPNLRKKYESGESGTKLAKEFGCGVNTIIFNLKKVGVTKFRRGNPGLYRNYSKSGWKMSEEAKRKISLSKLGTGTKQKLFICQNCGVESKGYDNGVRKFKFCSNKCTRVSNSKCDTFIERKVENWLLFNDVLYIKQFPYDFGCADFWLPESNLIIHCDGDYWHSLPKVKERDGRQDEYLEKNDYSVLRLEEREIKNNFPKIISKIEKKI